MVYLMLTRKVDLIFLCFSAPITSILCYRLTPGFFFNCYESFRMLKAFLAINKTQQWVPKQWHNCTVCGTVVTFQLWEDSAKLGWTFNKADELRCNIWKHHCIQPNPALSTLRPKCQPLLVPKRRWPKQTWIFHTACMDIL